MNIKSRVFSAQQLSHRLSALPRSNHIRVGYSGGADSTALLEALNELKDELGFQLSAVHFHHGLHARANEWQSHCEKFCEERAIALQVHILDLQLRPTQSPEEEARDQRYRCITASMTEGELYLTAHHADDNAETLVLNLLRGSGVEGLAGIPPLRRLGAGWLARPLLDFSRSSLEAFLDLRKVRWMDDPSNLDSAMDRNFLRNQLFPLIADRWPAYANSLNQASQNARDTVEVMNGLLISGYTSPVIDRHTLQLDRLLEFEPATQTAILRHWVRDKGKITPPRLRLAEFLHQLRHSESPDHQAEIRWDDQLIKRHGDLLWWQAEPYPVLQTLLAWPPGKNLDLPGDMGRFELSGNLSAIPENWSIGPRVKGASMRLHPSGPRRDLKDLLREMGVPPWLRNSIPILYWNKQAVSIADSHMEPELQNWLAEQKASLNWRVKHSLLQKLQSVSVLALQRKHANHEQ